MGIEQASQEISDSDWERHPEPSQEAAAAGIYVNDPAVGYGPPRADKSQWLKGQPLWLIVSGLCRLKNRGAADF